MDVSDLLARNFLSRKDDFSPLNVFKSYNATQKRWLAAAGRTQEEAKQLTDKIFQLELSLTKFKQENGDVFSKFKLNIDEIIKVSFDKKAINEKLKEINKELDDLEEKLR